MAFSIQQIKNGNSLHLVLGGAFDEDVNLKDLPKSGMTQLSIDFEKMEVINSCGIREWIGWILNFKSETQITFSKIPKVFVIQMNTVVGMFPPHTHVKSFFVPYVCENCNLFKNLLFTNGMEFKDGTLSRELDFKCDNCNEPLEMDIIESKYFRFIKEARG